MTKNKAADILDPETSKAALVEYDDDEARLEACNEACRIAATALRMEENRPLTLEQLMEMDGEPVYVTSSIGEQPMWYIVDAEELELKNPWDRITLEEWDEGYQYRAYRRKPEEGTT